MPYIAAEGLSFRYGSGREVLSDLSFEIGKGESVTILGDNGSGKSTLLSLFDTLLCPTSGKLTMNGLDCGNEKNHRAIRRGTGLVFQDPDSSFVSDILEDDTSFSPWCWLDDPEEIGNITSKALSGVGLLDRRKDSVRNLSGGEKQRASAAGIETMDPETYLFDEALSFLDGNCRRSMLERMKKLREEGKTVIQVSHYAEDAIFSDRVMILENGRLIRDGEPRDVLYDFEALEKAGIAPMPAAELWLKMKERGMEPEGHPLTDEEAAEEVMRCMQKH